jgi:hypothetical protein
MASRAAETLGRAFRDHPDVTGPDRVHPVRMTSRAVTITLELRQAGDELDGRASDGTGDGRAFRGWLGLLVAIDALLNAAPDQPV